MRLPVAVVLLIFAACAAYAAVDTDPDTPVAKTVDTVPCFAAITAADDDKIIAVCGEMIAHDKLEVSDRVKALEARAAARARKDQLDPAIADYDAVLKLAPFRPDLLNARGELWRRKGDRPHAIRDFETAMRLDPQNEVARANYKALALEIERMGAKLAVPSAQPKAPLK